MDAALVMIGEQPGIKKTALVVRSSDRPAASLLFPHVREIDCCRDGLKPVCIPAGRSSFCF